MTVLIRIMRVDDEPSVTKGGLRKSGSLGSSAPQPMAYQYGLCKVSQAEPDRHADLATMEVIAHASVTLPGHHWSRTVFWRSPAVIPAHTPGAEGASRAPHVCVQLVVHSASNCIGAAERVTGMP